MAMGTGFETEAEARAGVGDSRMRKDMETEPKTRTKGREEAGAQIDRDTVMPRPPRTSARGPSRHNMIINQQIINCQDARELCNLIATHVTEFKHVNVATAFRKLLQTRRQGMDRDVSMY